MGEGDSKLLLMIGAFLGWQGALFAIFAGAAQGLLTYVMTRITGLRLPDGSAAEAGSHDPSTLAADSGSQDAVQAPVVHDAALVAEEAGTHDAPPSYWGHLKLPFGPFLALGALEYLFFGELTIEAWWRFVQGT
jgi:leader peptidase (prepilin peptidase)/N-methyltransferase